MDLQQGTHAEMDESLRTHGVAMIRNDTHVFLFFEGDGRVHTCGAVNSISSNRTTNYSGSVLKKEISDEVNIKKGKLLLTYDFQP